MKPVRISLLLTAVVLLVLYASSPVWLGAVAAHQMPDGWRLDTLEIGYPRLSAIPVHELRMHGPTSAGELSLAAKNLRLEYRGLGAAAAEAWIDFHPHNRTPATGPFGPADLNLPLIAPVPPLPRLRVGLMHVRVLGASDDFPALELKALTLAPLGGGRNRLQAEVSVTRDARYSGRLQLETGPDGVSGSLRLPSAAGEDAWAVADFVQRRRQQPATTRLHLSLDAGRFDPSWADPFISALSAGLVQRLRGKFELTGNFSGKDTQAVQSLSLRTGQLQLDVREAALLDRLLPGLSLQTDGTVRALCSIVAAIRRPETPPSPPGPAPALEADLDVSYASAKQKMKLETSGFRLDDIDSAHIVTAATAGTLGLNWTLDAPFSYTNGTTAIAADGIGLSTTLRVTAGRLRSTGSARLQAARAKSLAASAKTVEVSWQDLGLPGLDGQLKTRTSGFKLALDGMHTSGVDFDTHYRLTHGTRITGGGNLLLNNAPLAAFAFTLDAQTGRFHVTLPTASVDAATVAQLLQALQIQPPGGLLLQQGDIDVQAEIDAGRQITATLSLQGRQLALKMQNSKASDGNFQFDTRFDNRGNGRETLLNGPLSASEVTLAGGLNLKNLQAQMMARMDAEQVASFEIANVRAQVLGGRLALAQLKFSPRGLEDTQVQLHDIDLGRLLALADINGLDGSGRLDLTLPVGTNQDGIHVQGGTFQSTAPGRLSYKKPGAVANNIGLQALENFEFKTLSGRIDYQSSGNFRITARLEGRNPDLYSGHAILFNLDINGALPQLFEALFLSGDFEQAVLKQIKQH